jgi:iron complex outermembrane receptor protein
MTETKQAMPVQLSAQPRRLAAALVAALLASADAAQAQLEEVTVTATRRSESMQDVAISMLSTSGEAIRDMGVTRGAEFAADIPAVTISQSPIGNFIFIRGIGTAGVNQGLELSTSIFHDGVYMGRHQLSRAPFMDLERIEVLRGPQSILFGKNTIGGAIHLLTAKPTRELEGSVTALYGNYGEQEVNGVLSGPITDSLSGRIAVRGYADRRLPRQHDHQRGRPGAGRPHLRLQLQWDASETLTFTPSGNAANSSRCSSRHS